MYLYPFPVLSSQLKLHIFVFNRIMYWKGIVPLMLFAIVRGYDMAYAVLQLDRLVRDLRTVVALQSAMHCEDQECSNKARVLSRKAM